MHVLYVCTVCMYINTGPKYMSAYIVGTEMYVAFSTYRLMYMPVFIHIYVGRICRCTVVFIGPCFVR